MTPLRISYCEHLPNSARVYGPNLPALLRRLQLPWQYDHREKCVLISRGSAADLLAWCQASKRVVIVSRSVQP